METGEIGECTATAKWVSFYTSEIHTQDFAVGVGMSVSVKMRD